MTPRKKRRHPRSSEADRDGASYICPHCGETIVIPLDASGGSEQEYVEDCPVCCSPNVIHVEFFGEGESPQVWAEAE
jgi:cysteine-rich CPXCG protein